MTNAAKSSTGSWDSADRHRIVGSPRFRRAMALSALGVAAVTLAACGSSSSASTTSSTAARSNSQSGSGTGGSGTPRQAPGASGSIAAINGTSLEVQSSTGQTTVTYTPTTTFAQTVAVTSSSVTNGSCITAVGKPTSTPSTGKSAFGGPVTATTVSITQPVSGSCTGGFGGFGRGGGSGRAGGGFTGGGSRPRPTGGAFRGGGSGQFAVASGSVTSVAGSAVTVSETNPTTKAVSSVAVTLTPSTTFTERATAASSNLAVGKCANAIGTADSTGAVTARSIVISTPGANGCTTGFEGFRGGGGGFGAGAGSAGGA